MVGFGGRYCCPTRPAKRDTLPKYDIVFMDVDEDFASRIWGGNYATQQIWSHALAGPRLRR